MNLENFIHTLKQWYWKARGDIRAGRPRAFIRRLRRELLATERAHLLIARAKAESSLGKLTHGSAETSKHILLLAWLFPPMVSGGVYRPTALLKYGSHSGWRFSVFAGPSPDQLSDAGQELHAQIPKNATVLRMKPSDLKPSKNRFGEVDGGLVNAFTAFFEAKKTFRNAPPSTVIASGPPFHNFIAAVLIARYFGARVVLEYRDEWSECPFDFVEKHNANRQWESWCLSKADLVIFTTESQLKHQSKMFPQLNTNKCVIIQNGWDPEDFSGSGKHNGFKVGNQKTLTLAYFGHLGAMGQPTEILNSLTELLDADPVFWDHLKVLFVGFKSEDSLSQIREFKYEGVIELIEQVPKKHACEMMASAGALLLLNPPSLNRYIQGKFYDYLASGTPILVYGEGGEMAEIVNKLHAGIVIPANNASALKQALLDIKSYKPIVGPEMDDWLKNRTRKVLALQTLAILDKLEKPV